MAELNTAPLEAATAALVESVELNRTAYRDMTDFNNRFQGETSEIISELTKHADLSIADAKEIRVVAADAILEAHRLRDELDVLDQSVQADAGRAATAADEAEEHAALAQESEDLSRSYADQVNVAAVAALGAYGAAYDVAQDAKVDAERAETARDEVQSLKQETAQIRDSANQTATAAQEALEENTEEIEGLREDIDEIRLQRVNDHADFTTKTAQLTALVNEAIDKYFAQEA